MPTNERAWVEHHQAAIVSLCAGMTSKELDGLIDELHDLAMARDATEIHLGDIVVLQGFQPDDGPDFIDGTILNGQRAIVLSVVDVNPTTQVELLAQDSGWPVRRIFVSKECMRKEVQ